jgi:hypothetical protein
MAAKFRVTDSVHGGRRLLTVSVFAGELRPNPRAGAIGNEPAPRWGNKN